MIFGPGTNHKLKNNNNKNLHYYEAAAASLRCWHSLKNQLPCYILWRIRWPIRRFIGYATVYTSVPRVQK
jgi:hypothetical protein